MHCLACGTGKEPGSWVCPNCGAPIPKPQKPAYEAGGWEWIAAVLFLVLAFLTLLPAYDPIGAEWALCRLAFTWLALAFAFSAARDDDTRNRLAGAVCLTFWLTTATLLAALSAAMGDFSLTVECLLMPGYCLLVLLVERISWQFKLARL